MARRLRLPALLLLIAVPLLLGAPGAARAAAGRLDRSFAGGTVRPSFEPTASAGVVSAMAADSRGVVVAGDGFRCPRCKRDFYVARYTNRGRRDERFGTGGVVDLGPGEGESSEAPLLASDGRGGTIVALPGDSGVTLMRLKREGALDRRFGTNGRTVLSCGCKEAGSWTMVLDPSGRIVLTNEETILGRNFPQSLVFRTRLRLARYLLDGNPDRGFGRAGLVTAGVGINQMLPTPLPRADGSILLAGRNENRWPDELAMVRVTAAGRVQQRYAATALENRQPFTHDSFAEPQALLPGPGGSSELFVDSERSPFMLRIRSDGSAARGFGRGGARPVAVAPRPVAVDRAGRFFGAGAEVGEKSAVLRLLPSGRRDPSFNRGRPRPVLDSFPNETAVAVQPDGRPLILTEGIPACREGGCGRTRPRLTRLLGGPAPASGSRSATR